VEVNPATMLSTLDSLRERMNPSKVPTDITVVEKISE
jgi:hypothetical protein